MPHAQWSINRHYTTPECLVIDDISDPRHSLTITNDVEWVVAQIVAAGLLTPGRRLMYFDSLGDLDEIMLDGERFVGFAPGPWRGTSLPIARRTPS